MKSVISGIKKVKLNKLEDKSLSTALFKNFMRLCAEQRAYEAQQKDLQELFMSENQEESEAIGKLQNELNMEQDANRRVELVKEINSHTQYLEAVKAFNEKFEALGKDEVKVELIDAEKFGEAYQKQEDFDVSVVEEICPLFKA